MMCAKEGHMSLLFILISAVEYKQWNWFSPIMPVKIISPVIQLVGKNIDKPNFHRLPGNEWGTVSGVHGLWWWDALGRLHKSLVCLQCQRLHEVHEPAQQLLSPVRKRLGSTCCEMIHMKLHNLWSQYLYYCVLLYNDLKVLIV